MWVKICGITSEEDALYALAMGADALGFMFVAGSKRQMAPGRVADIVKRLPADVPTIGVFRDDAPERVVELVTTAGLRGAQLHGRETPEQVAYVAQRVGLTIKAFTAGSPDVVQARHYPAQALMLDAATPGSGEVFDWTLVEGMPLSSRVILAGGLTPENVARAIAVVKPWGVDVSTGVESAPGRKDALKVQYFIANAKRAGAEIAASTGRPERDADGLEPDPSDLRPAGGPYDWQEES